MSARLAALLLVHVVRLTLGTAVAVCVAASGSSGDNVLGVFPPLLVWLGVDVEALQAHGQLASILLGASLWYSLDSRRSLRTLRTGRVLSYRYVASRTPMHWMCFNLSCRCGRRSFHRIELGLIR